MNYSDWTREYNKAKETNSFIKLAGIEFFGAELEELMQSNERYIIKYRSIYYLSPANYKDNGKPKFKVEEVYKHTGILPLTKRGRFHTMNYKQVNNLIGQELFIR